MLRRGQPELAMKQVRNETKTAVTSFGASLRSFWPPRYMRKAKGNSRACFGEFRGAATSLDGC
jgi:hypothetical protein